MDRIRRGHRARDGSASEEREVSIWRRLKYLLLPSYRRAEERELQEELESLRAIAGPRELGNLSQAAENAREVLGWNWLDDLGQDFRYALRTLLRHRRVTAVALLSLGIGIGANSVVFTILNTMLFQPMPFPRPDRLVRVGFHQQNNPGQLTGLTRGNCTSFSKSEIFEQFGCYTDGVSASIADANPSGLSTSERINGQRLTAGAAQAAGIPPLFGRWFTESDEREGADLVMLISSSLWQRRFGGSGDALGRVVHLDGEAADRHRRTAGAIRIRRKSHECRLLDSGSDVSRGTEKSSPSSRRIGKIEIRCLPVRSAIRDGRGGGTARRRVAGNQ